MDRDSLRLESAVDTRGLTRESRYSQTAYVSLADSRPQALELAQQYVEEKYLYRLGGPLPSSVLATTASEQPLADVAVPRNTEQPAVRIAIRRAA